MTGYGRGESLRGGVKFTVEISTVNRKQAELSLYIPREMDALESRVRDEINAKVARGRITCKIQYSAKSMAQTEVRIDRSLAKKYAKQYRALGDELKLEGSIGLDTILRAPGVLQATEEPLDIEDLWIPLRTAVRSALRDLLGMRAKEGSNLKRDLQKRIGALKKAVQSVAKQAPKTAKRHRDVLLDRLKQSELELRLDDERVLKEVALYADRIDITEELTRLESHFGQFADYAKSNSPVGRTLDFLSQEMNREVNTIGSKANDPIISRLVVTMKSELEKFREQVQNVE